MTNGSLMKVESIAEHSASDNWYWKPIFGLFESGRFTQVLLIHLSVITSHQQSMRPTIVRFEQKYACVYFLRRNITRKIKIAPKYKYFGVCFQLYLSNNPNS